MNSVLVAQSAPATAVVVVGASAGGVEALQALVAGLPGDLAAAVLVVLHIPAHAPSQLESILARATSLRVRTARDNAPLDAGTVYVAPPDRHLMVERDRMRVTYAPHEGRLRPSVDVLFRSAAAAFGPRALGVVLTGALDDGTSGLWNIKDRGGRALVQDPADAMFPDMPASALAHVDVDGSLPLHAMAAAVVAQLAAMPADAAAPGVPERLRVENVIAREGNGLRAGVMDLGPVSSLTCPECHGVLVQIEEGPIIRFRCHTGHAYSQRALLADVDRVTHMRLWDLVRSIEERILLLEQLAGQANSAVARAHFQGHADYATAHLAPLRELALDPRFASDAQARGPAPPVEAIGRDASDT